MTEEEKEEDEEEEEQDSVLFVAPRKPKVCKYEASHTAVFCSF